MKKVSEYQEHAEQCRQLAATAKAGHKQMLLKMADTWEFLAKDRVDQIARVERIKWLDKRNGPASAGGIEVAADNEGG